MTLVVEVEFLHGTLRAEGAGDAAVAGGADAGEWPPSPARLFSAFVAADGTGDRCRVTDGSGLRVLESAAPPVIRADDADSVQRSVRRERFVVPEERSKGDRVQEYAARQATLVRPGVTLAPRRPRIAYVFDDVLADGAALEALRRRAARIGYLGAADHPARVTLHTDLPERLAELPAWEPATAPERSHVVLPVCDDGLLRRLDDQHEAWLAGRAVRRSWLSTHHSRYADPGAATLDPVGSLTLLRLEQSVAGRHALILAEVLRRAVLSRLGDGAHAIIHGHGLEGDGRRQSRWLAFPDVGHRYADGRLHALGVWLPPDTEDDVVADLRGALLDIRRLAASDRLVVEVVPHDGVTGPMATRPLRWSRWASVWRTATPAVFERHGDIDADTVRQWFRHAGHPVPEGVRWSRSPLIDSGVRMRPSQLRHRYRTPFTHLEVRYDAPVGGEVMAVGRGRQFGLGLLAPIVDRAR